MFEKAIYFCPSRFPTMDGHHGLQIRSHVQLYEIYSLWLISIFLYVWFSVIRSASRVSFLSSTEFSMAWDRMLWTDGWFVFDWKGTFCFCNVQYSHSCSLQISASNFKNQICASNFKILGGHFKVMWWDLTFLFKLLYDWLRLLLNIVCTSFILYWIIITDAPYRKTLHHIEKHFNLNAWKIVDSPIEGSYKMTWFGFQKETPTRS